MYLKSLTLRGFKSFASSTRLELEPGITAVVGPNGSGKSNVVDALSWVMGEQGAKTLRGGKMEDVIFAGTAGRPPLGRAEVVLTIDNSDGALPIEYSEVTVSRTMFRSGGSEYAINGNSCRLLDVQELLSDSGIGREMHVIVGQGQLDSVLRATPEDRRGFVEEAAGVLKHRKRKEKALRKLDATEGNLTRLSDLLHELRRQLKPLGRQAEVARQAATIQATVRDARARLLADDIATARTTMATETADEDALRNRRQEVEQQLAAARQAETELDESLAVDAPKLAGAQETWYALTSAAERLRGTTSLAAERIRVAQADDHDRVPGRDPVELENEAAAVQHQVVTLDQDIAAVTENLQSTVSEREVAESAYSAEERRIAELLRAAADRREGLAKLHGQVNALTSRAEAADAEIGRLKVAADAAVERAEQANREFGQLEQELAQLSDGESGLDEQLGIAETEYEAAQTRRNALISELNETERNFAALKARTEALALSMARKDGSGALLQSTERLRGVVGSMAELLTVKSGYETAISAGLGSAAAAVAMSDQAAAIDAISFLAQDDLGRAAIVVSDALGIADGSNRKILPAGVNYAADLVEAPASIAQPVAHLLQNKVVVDDLAAGARLVNEFSELVAITRQGDVVTAVFVEGGSASEDSLLAVAAAYEEAETNQIDCAERLTQLRTELDQATIEQNSAQERLRAATSKLNESDAALSAMAERLGQLGTAARSAQSEAERNRQSISQAEQARDSSLAGLAELQERLRQASDAPDDEPDTNQLEELAAAATAARQAETEARLRLRTAEERRRALVAQVESLVKSAETERESRRVWQERMEQRRAAAETAAEVLRVAEVVAERLHESTTQAAALRAELEQQRSGRVADLKHARAAVRDLREELDRLTDSVHRDEMARAQLRLKLETLETRALEELGIEPDTLVTEYGPDQLVTDLGSVEQQTPPETVPFVRADQERRLRSAERSLAMLGKINPLALEEFAAMEERHQFLSEQLDDLRRTRTDLLSIVDDVDRKVEQVFTAAWIDVEREFIDVFSRLFPGGEGKLVLTDPSNMLLTGIDVEARPPGKKVKRLSLLSGGERSLVAVAFLVALFKARPSPFYILDEVEAALDDTNLGRLLEIYEELRANSQLIVITHQKRTMEVADALYGVSMRGDGVSAVISQRLREEESA